MNMVKILAVQNDDFQCLGVFKGHKYYWVFADGRRVETWQQAIASAVSTGLFAQVVGGEQILFGKENYILVAEESYRQKA
jgi:hypothetical protein